MLVSVVIEPNTDVRRCPRIKCPTGLGTLGAPRSRRTIRRLLLPGHWFLHDHDLHFNLYS
jgi:hypothetical protein